MKICDVRVLAHFRERLVGCIRIGFVNILAYDDSIHSYYRYI
jgi:hypothetical protein